MLTWDELAGAIAKMPADARSQLVLTQDTNTGELGGYTEVVPPDEGLPYLLWASQDEVEKGKKR